MINTSIESGHVPATMKLTNVIPIYKSKDKQMLNNYRPISLLPIFLKILEKLFIKGYSLRKLELYGIRCIALQWFEHYLTGRKQYVMYNNTQSSMQYITCGVPQGSVLGPLLFLIYINDIPNCLKHSKSIVFADDTAIFASCNNLNTLFNNVNGDLANLINWFRANKLSLNIAKTNYILFPSCKFVNVGGNMKLYVGADEIIRNE